MLHGPKGCAVVSLNKSTCLHPCVKEMAESAMLRLCFEKQLKRATENGSIRFPIHICIATNQSINQSKRKTSNANGQTNLGHKHKAPDHNHEATQPMVDLPHTS